MSFLTALEQETGRFLAAAQSSVAKCTEALACKDKGAAMKAAEDLKKEAWSIHNNVGLMGLPSTPPPPELPRSPLSSGRQYRYNGYKVGFEVVHVAFRDHPEDDGGLQGVAIKWQGYPPDGRKGSAFYPCKSDVEFWEMQLFANAYDKPAEDSKSESTKRGSSNVS